MIYSDDGVRRCDCRTKRIKDRRLARIPNVFRSVSLETLKAAPKIHAGQGPLVEAVKKNPGGSFYLSGDFGTGKSLVMWALYRYAVEQDLPRVVVCTLAELVNDYRKQIDASVNGAPPYIPMLTADELRQDEIRYSVFIDDLDKARPTEYAMEQFFEIANAIYDFRHQLVVTTNLEPDRLVRHFARADERFGGAIVRRILDRAEVFQMF